MKISIIVPIYNSENYIEKLINSILFQTYKNYELILIDDGSTDNTYNVIKKYEKDNIKIFKKNNEGVGETRKFGFNAATGDLVFFCDSDDYLFDNCVLQKINDMFTNKEIDILMFDALDINLKSKKVVNCFSKEIKPGLHDIKDLNNYFVFGPLFLKVFKKSMLDNSCFAASNNFEDTYTTYMYLNKCNNFYYENDVYYVYDETINSQSLTKIKSVDKFLEAICLIEDMAKKLKLKGLCKISAFNYYVYMIDVLNSKILTEKENSLLLKKIKDLEKIFISDIDFIKNNVSDKKIQKYINFKSEKISKKVILVDGVSTSGKSTVTQMLCEQMKLNNVKVKWLHEEAFNEFDLLLQLPKRTKLERQVVIEKMEKLIENWYLFYKKIAEDDMIYVIDSNFFKNIHDFLLFNDFSYDEIRKFYTKLIKPFNKEDLLFIFLKRTNIKESFINSFKIRGPFWENCLKKMNNELQQKNSNMEALFTFETNYQCLIENLFNYFDVDKIKFSTDDENWNKYLNIILDKLNLNKVESEIEKYDYLKYIGKYNCQDWDISVFRDKERLFMSCFWPKMELKYLRDDVFSLDRFPLNVKFIDDGLVFQGELVWDMKDKKFIKQK